ncbi:hypothetical protein WJ88_28935 [Burkholderia ubonensis]|nr:hypothetical protein WJ88_28935 [Burkholderia ubonensis]
MKAHIGVDADSGLVHSVVGTSANVSDVSQAHALLHGHEQEAFGDAGYIGVDKRDEMKSKSVKWRVAAKRGKLISFCNAWEISLCNPCEVGLIYRESLFGRIRHFVGEAYHEG